MIIINKSYLSFDPIVVSGPNTSLPHGVAGERKIQEGDFVTMDFGCLYHGYCSDMTRTVAVGYATEEMKKVYNTVLEAQLAGIAATKAGVIGSVSYEQIRVALFFFQTMFDFFYHAMSS